MDADARDVRVAGAAGHRSLVVTSARAPVDFASTGAVCLEARESQDDRGGAAALRGARRLRALAARRARCGRRWSSPPPPSRACCPAPTARASAPSSTCARAEPGSCAARISGHGDDATHEAIGAFTLATDSDRLVLPRRARAPAGVPRARRGHDPHARSRRATRSTRPSTTSCAGWSRIGPRKSSRHSEMLHSSAPAAGRCSRRTRGTPHRGDDDEHLRKRRVRNDDGRLDGHARPATCCRSSDSRNDVVLARGPLPSLPLTAGRNTTGPGDVSLRGPFLVDFARLRLAARALRALAGAAAGGRGRRPSRGQPWLRAPTYPCRPFRPCRRACHRRRPSSSRACRRSSPRW